MAVCKFCGKEYVKSHNRQMYCCADCRNESDKEHTRNRVHRWYHRNKHKLSEKRRWGLGSGELGPHAYVDDFDREFQVVHRELSRHTYKRW